MPDSNLSRVLIVEDDPIIRWDLVDLFERNGFTVLEAGSADEGARLLADGSAIDALVTDIETPGTLDGVGLAWLAHERSSSMPILVISGAVKPDTGDLPVTAAFFSKPFDTADILKGLAALGGS